MCLLLAKFLTVVRVNRAVRLMVLVIAKLMSHPSEILAGDDLTSTPLEGPEL
jgi:hypothetical protein